MNSPRWLILAAAVTFGGSSASAAVIPIANSDFEAQSVPSGTFIDNGAPTDWSPYDPHGLIGK